ncbi:hypothetical protein [Sphingomonas sp. Leaf198]|uniref:hypothetical protein n=1 Tax=Sphingomonas sp. Leaf198 TaxID=1736299 RepID=UPI0006F49306|nr:hypothetical protein [Sphingomonas sp. Leaf198]KQS49506.1 hypothetical protein ASG20_10945 [Sphingomonas sp. Leaf198]
MSIELLTTQVQANAAFRLWVDAMVAHSTLRDEGWWIDGSGLLFTNYGHGAHGVVENQLMLGVDAQTGDCTVKIVCPDVSQGDRGKLTTVGRDDDGRLVLLREGWLKRNNISPAIRADFEALSGLAPVPVRVGGIVSKRRWYVVAELDGATKDIVRQTTAFTLACVRARSAAAGREPATGTAAPVEPKPYGFGLDEKGRIVIVTRQGGTSKVRALQGYVFEALRKQLGEELTKPTANGYAVDGMVASVNALIEIKTGTFAHHCYEAVGQLALYPSLIGLDRNLAKVALLPDTPPLRPAMAGALSEAGVEVFTYAVRGKGKKPIIEFTKAFLSRCASTVPPVGLG